MVGLPGGPRARRRGGRKTAWRGLAERGDWGARYAPRNPVARAAGEAWLGCLPDVERRLAELQKRRDAAHADLASAMQSATALIAAPVAVSI